MDKIDTSFYESEEWGLIRHHVLVRSYGICEHCLLRAVEQIHVRCYDSFGPKMDLRDVEGVCVLCHAEIHGRLQLPEGKVLQHRMGSPKAKGDNGWTANWQKPGHWMSKHAYNFSSMQIKDGRNQSTLLVTDKMHDHPFKCDSAGIIEYLKPEDFADDVRELVSDVFFKMKPTKKSTNKGKKKTKKKIKSIKKEN